MMVSTDQEAESTANSVLFCNKCEQIGIEELFLQITRKLVERKQEIERIKRINAENAITLQQLEDERLQQAQTTNNSSVCCGI